ncbi:MAG: inositol monophosphatase [Deltaproteobacteria bacterium]|nr:MAG: inositol monophosphatase [Deltaproteobacteria bacterium]
MEALESYLACAQRAADQAAEILLAGLGEEHRQIEHKGAVDLVTEYDRRSEARICEVITRHFPDHRILAEEGSQRGGESLYRWVIDPLDGTTNYAHGYPAFAVSIALVHAERLLVGLVDAPALGERWYALRGGGAYRNGTRIRVSGVDRLANALMATGFPYDRHERADFYLRYFRAFMMRTHGIRRNGSAALDLCNLATGRFDGFWEFDLHPWDIAAGMLIIEEAGGRLSDFSGAPITIEAKEILASNGHIHEEMLEVMRQIHA